MGLDWRGEGGVWTCTRCEDYSVSGNMPLFCIKCDPLSGAPQPQHTGESPTVQGMRELLIEMASAYGDVKHDGSFRGPFASRLAKYCGGVA